ncbi:hypothetical protein, partial [Bacillus pumilus]|uniref:hypothetical protein n=1 Tax=Bacillus pumilus TaxID=1408 RepID=UPI0037043BBD
MSVEKMDERGLGDVEEEVWAGYWVLLSVKSRGFVLMNDKEGGVRDERVYRMLGKDRFMVDRVGNEKDEVY